MIPNYSMIPAAAIRWSPGIWWSPAIRWSIRSMDFDNRKVYGDIPITDGLVWLVFENVYVYKMDPRTIWHFGQFDTIMASRTIWHQEGKEDDLTPSCIIGQFDTNKWRGTIWHHIQFDTKKVVVGQYFTSNHIWRQNNSRGVKFGLWRWALLGPEMSCIKFLRWCMMV